MTAAAYSLAVPTSPPDPVDVLRDAMTRHDLNQRELADVLQVSNETVNRWLNRRTAFDDAKLLLALRKLGDRPADYGVEEPRHPKRSGLSMLAVPEEIADDPPAWFVEYAAQQTAMLEAIQRRFDEVIDILEHSR